MSAVVKGVWKMISNDSCLYFLSYAQVTPPIKRCNLVCWPWNLGWLCDLPWLVEYGGGDVRGLPAFTLSLREAICHVKNLTTWDNHAWRKPSLAPWRSHVAGHGGCPPWVKTLWAIQPSTVECSWVSGTSWYQVEQKNHPYEHCPNSWPTVVTNDKLFLSTTFLEKKVDNDDLSFQTWGEEDFIPGSRKKYIHKSLGILVEFSRVAILIHSRQVSPRKDWIHWADAWISDIWESVQIGRVEEL